jgi:O-antigen/teichoic acid export membrane protein
VSRRLSSLFVVSGMAANTVLVAVQSVVLIPLYVRGIGARLYGAWLGSGDLLSWMMVSDLGIADLLVQKIGAAHGRGDEREAGEWFATGLAVLAAVAAVVAAAGVGISFLLPRLYDLPPDEGARLQWAFAVAAAASATTVLFNACFGYARAAQRPALLAAASTLSTLAAFVTALALALAGHGLAAIALGFVARAAVLWVGMAVFLARDIPASVRAHMRVRASVAREMARSAPATALAVAAYVGMNQSELFIVSLLLGPEAAAAYMLNRKAVELARALADTVVWASFGSFAHLVGSDERHRALDVYREVLSVRTTLSVASGAAFVALNQSFVSVWVGAEYFRGQWLAALLALQAVVAGNCFLANYLYRASGAVVPGAVLLVAESAARLVLMVALARVVGMPGIPLAGIVTGGVFLALTHARVRALGARLGAADRPLALRYWAACAAVLAAGAALGTAAARPHWAYVLGAGAVLTAAALAGLAWNNHYLRRYPASLAARLASPRGA